MVQIYVRAPLNNVEMEARLAIFVSILSLLISSLSYFRPKKPGGAAQWAIEIDEMNHRAYLKQVGSAKARKVSISIDSVIPGNEIYKSKSFPNDVITVPIYKTIGKPSVNTRIKWKGTFGIAHEREFDV